MQICITVLIVWFSMLAASAGEVKMITWDSIHAAAPAKLDAKKKHLLPLIRAGVSSLPEPTVMQLTFLGGSALGLPSEKASSLHSLLAKRYREIATDETFSKMPSALEYCFSKKKPTTGLSSIFTPESVSSKTSVILFLHGYGGSFTFYLHYLASVFPDHIIVCPAYGISCSHIPSAYLQECLDAVSKDLKIQLKRPLLMGLSAGGFGGFREYARRPDSYTGYICLAAYPPKRVIPISPRNGQIRLIAGMNETFVKNGTLQRAEHDLKRRTVDYLSHLIPDQDHFFMLSAEETTKKNLKKWAAELLAD